MIKVEQRKFPQTILIQNYCTAHIKKHIQRVNVTLFCEKPFNQLVQKRNGQSTSHPLRPASPNFCFNSLICFIKICIENIIGCTRCHVSVCAQLIAQSIPFFVPLATVYMYMHLLNLIQQHVFKAFYQFHFFLIQSFPE